MISSHEFQVQKLPSNSSYDDNNIGNGTKQGSKNEQSNATKISIPLKAFQRTNTQELATEYSHNTSKKIKGP